MQLHLEALLDGRDDEVPKSRMIGMGELGLDTRVITDTSLAGIASALDLQVKVLQAQAVIAQQRDLPIILGCYSDPGHQATLWEKARSALAAVSEINTPFYLSLRP